MEFFSTVAYNAKNILMLEATELKILSDVSYNAKKVWTLQATTFYKIIF
jgi:hypothetical protein